MQHEQHQNAEMLAKKCSNRTLEKIVIAHNNNPVGYHDFCKSLPCKIVGVGVHDNVMFWILDSDFSIWLKPSSTCSWREKASNCTRIKMVTDKGDVCYDDPRGFSLRAIEFLPNRSATIERLRLLKEQTK